MIKISVGANTPIFNDPAYSYEVNRVLTHWKFEDQYKFYDYDIGLVQTQTSIQFSDTVRAIALPNKEPIMSGLATFAGYGYVKVKFFLYNVTR